MWPTTIASPLPLLGDICIKAKITEGCMSFNLFRQQVSGFNPSFSMIGLLGVVDRWQVPSGAQILSRRMLEGKLGNVLRDTETVVIVLAFVDLPLISRCKASFVFDGRLLLEV